MVDRQKPPTTPESSEKPREGSIGSAATKRSRSGPTLTEQQHAARSMEAHRGSSTAAGPRGKVGDLRRPWRLSAALLSKLRKRDPALAREFEDVLRAYNGLVSDLLTRRRQPSSLQTRRGPIQRQYDNMLPRVLSAVTSMATGRGRLRERLAWSAGHAAVFAPQDVPRALWRRYQEFRELIASPTVPAVYQRHEHPFKSDPAFYLSSAKAERAAVLLTSMLETIAQRLDWTEEELETNDQDDDEAEG